MITGKKKQESNYIESDEILQKTNGGYDIYMYYLGKVSRLMQRPWGKKEKKISWGIFCKNGIWFWKDQANEEAGTAIQFVEKYFSLSFKEACDKITWDFQLKPKGKEIFVKSPIVTWDEPTEEDKVYVPMKFTSKVWDKQEYDFWTNTDVTKLHCEKYETWAVKDWAIKDSIKNTWKTGKRLHSKEVVWAYYAPEEDAVKIYFPERGYDEYHVKFKNNVSGNYLWNYENLLNKCGETPCEKGLIQKSMKDLLVSTLLTENVIASQNEQSKLFLSEHTINKVHKIFKNVWMAFGSDPDGVAKSQKVTAVTNWNWVNPKKQLLPDINDFYGLARKFNLRAVEDLLKEKNYL